MEKQLTFDFIEDDADEVEQEPNFDPQTEYYLAYNDYLRELDE